MSNEVLLPALMHILQKRNCKPAYLQFSLNINRDSTKTIKNGHISTNKIAPKNHLEKTKDLTLEQHLFQEFGEEGTRSSFAIWKEENNEPRHHL